MLAIKRVDSNLLRRQFIKFPHKLYQNNPYWVPMFYSETKKVLKGEVQMFANGDHDFFVALRDSEVVGRIAVGIEEKLNKAKGIKHAFFTLFEAEEDRDIADLLLKTAFEWGEERGMVYLKGPVSPTNGDDHRGMLVKGFGSLPPVLMPYNPEYYLNFFEDFDTYLEYVAYHYDLSTPIPEDRLSIMKKVIERYGDFDKDEIDRMGDLELSEKISHYMFEKRGYRIEQVHLKTKEQRNRAVENVYNLMNNSYPDTWEEDLLPPTKDEVHEIVQELKSIIDPGMALIAFHGDEPAGIAVTIPDVSEGIKKAKGKLFPFGWFHLLQSKKNTKKARGALLLVTKQYQNKGIPGYLVLNMRKNLLEMNYKTVELSSISAMNKEMNGVYEWMQLKVGKRYKVFGKSVKGDTLSLEDIYGNAAGLIEKGRKKQHQ